MPPEEIISEMLSNPLTDGLTITGGEPFIQAADNAGLAAVAREKGLSVWVYSGLLFEDIKERARNEPDVMRLLEQTNVLVDGRFIKSKKSLSLKWRGSRNQRIIDVPKSLAAGKVVEFRETAS
jgi:anaerobic ribonucleoside-triphosphate reductase activating protein